MRKANKKFYITTSIAYTNAAPHIGFALEIVQADVLARYHRILGEDAFFLTGTDEHGAKNARTAEESRRTPKEFTDEISSRYRELTKTLNISNDEPRIKFVIGPRSKKCGWRWIKTATCTGKSITAFTAWAARLLSQKKI